jgi:glycosyltransferase involved in cell wall biosynthesis
LPTYYSTEAQPLSILEALSYGKIVITTNHRGIPDMVINEYNGLIVESKDDELKNKLNKVIDEVNNTTPSKYNLYKLKELKNGLN